MWSTRTVSMVCNAVDRDTALTYSVLKHLVMVRHSTNQNLNTCIRWLILEHTTMGCLPAPSTVLRVTPQTHTRAQGGDTWDFVLYPNSCSQMGKMGKMLQ